MKMNSIYNYVRYPAFFCLFIFSFQTKGQLKITDSLVKIVETAKEDTTKVNLLYQISEICEERDILKYSIPSLELAKRLNYKKGIASNLNNIGYYYYFVANDNEKALDNYNRSLILHREMKNYPAESTVLFNMGLVYRASGLIEKALDCFLGATRIREKTGDTTGIIKSLNYTGEVYEKLNLHKEAFDCYLKGYELQKLIKDGTNIPTTLSSIARVFEANHNNDKAEEFYTKIIDFINTTEPSLHYKKELAHALFQLGNLYSRKGIFEKAHQHFAEALKLNMELNDQYGVAFCYVGLGNLKYGQNSPDEAIGYFEKAFSIGMALNNSDIIFETSERLSQLYETKHEFEKAYKMHKLFKQCNDSINGLNVRNAVLKKQMEYVFEKKEEVLKSEYEKEKAKAIYEKNILRLILAGLSILFILAVIIGFLVLRQHKLKAQFQSMQLEQKLLRSQMNPHFIYNCLQSIQNFIEDKKAVKYLSSFGALARAVLENSSLETIPLYKEIELLEHYLQLQKLLYEDQFEYTIEVDKELDPDNIAIPPMLSQPFIENAIEHGFRNMQNNGLLEIVFSLKDLNLILEIKDNGSEIKATANKNHHSLATSITRERINLLNKGKKHKTSFTISEAYPLQSNKGVKVVFTIPIQ